MYQHWLEPAILIVVGLCFLLTTSGPVSNHDIQPAGPKMCDHLCSRRIGCSGFLYMPLHLSCRLIVEKTSSEQQSLYYHKVSKRFLAKENLTCLHNSKILYTKTNNPKCRQSQLKLSRQMKFTRLLMLPKGWKVLLGRQLYFRNKTVGRYPYVSIKNTLEVAYISSTRKLVIADLFSLFLMTLDDTDKTLINCTFTVSGITVDEEKQLVFLTSFDDWSINVMTTCGKGLKRITKLPGEPGHLAADSKRQVIYVVICRRCITQYTYKGERREVIAKGHIYPQMYFNSERDVLYYIAGGQKWNFFKMFLSSRTTYTIPSQVKPNPYGFYVYSNTLYFLPHNRTNRQKMHLLSDSGKHIATIETGFDTDVTNVALCAVH